MREFDIEKAKKKLKKELSPFRYAHTLGCADTCRAMAERFGVDPEKAYITGLLHDNAKDMKFAEQIAYAEGKGVQLSRTALESPHITHAPVGAIRARYEFGMEDEEVLSAIDCHTTGKTHMSTLDKILFVADLIEPNRDHSYTDGLREKAKGSLDETVLACMDRVIGFVLEKRELLCFETVEARNYLLREEIGVFN